MTSPAVDNEDITLVRGETLSIDVYLTYDTGEPVLAEQISPNKMKAAARLQDGTRIPLTITALPEEGCFNLFSDVDTSKFIGDSFLVNVGIKNLADTAPDDIRIATFNQTFYIVNSATDITKGFNPPAYYQIVFKDWDNTVISDETLLECSTITVPEDPERTGYTFREWFPELTLYAVADAEYVAQYDINYYDLSYFVDGQQYGETESIAYNSPITTKPAPTKTGYTFDGWEDEPTVMPADDVEVNGTFTINRHHIKYYADGELYQNVEKQYADSITPLPLPTKAGHTYSAWSPALPATMPDNDISTYTVASVNVHVVKWYIDGVYYSQQQIAYGNAIPDLEPPTRAGHTFSGWAAHPSTMPDNDVTINGYFDANIHNIYYTVDGEPYQTQQLAYGQPVVPIAEPIREGAVFSGWGSYPSTMPDNDITIAGTFTDMWQVKYYRRYDNVATLLYTDSYAYGATITPRPLPTEEGYEFSAWSPALPETMPEEDLYVYTEMTAVEEYIVGDNAKVRIYQDGTETIAKVIGTGSTYSYPNYMVGSEGEEWIIIQNDSPFFSMHRHVDRIIVESGITVLNHNLFGGSSSGLTADEVIMLGTGAINIGTGAFRFGNGEEAFSLDIDFGQRIPTISPLHYGGLYAHGAFEHGGIFAKYSNSVLSQWTQEVKNSFTNSNVGCATLATFQGYNA